MCVSDTSSRTNGFTLTEMLVAMAVLALFAELLVQGIGTGQRYWQGAAARMEVAEAIDGAENTLRARLERMYFPTRYDALPPYASFDGTESEASFDAPAPESQAPSALRHYKLAVSPDGELVLSSRSILWGYLPDRVSGAPLTETVISGVDHIELGYFDGAQWLNAWHKKAKPPALLRVRVHFAQGDRRWWPDLIVNPLVNIDSDCVRSFETYRCAGRP